ncbi:MAG: ExbD/TolR family protein [Rhodoferax sp.]
MAFGLQSPTSDDDAEVMNEINMTPLVDVMLVLLIIFIITVPVMKHAVNVELPQASASPQAQHPQIATLSVDAAGAYFLQQEPISGDALDTHMRKLAQQEPQPELHIRGDRAVRYEAVATAMASAQRAGLRKIGFITEPRP